ncbi:MAG: sugar ABC transporter permease [Pseudomonadota bacterium]
MGRSQRLSPWLFLAPAAIYFFVLVIYPIFGSFWVSFHDWDGTTFECSDGRTLQELADDETCRRVPLMTWVGWENYERFFDKTPRDIGRIRDYVVESFSGTEEEVRWPRLSVETKVLLNNVKWLILFPVAIPIGLAFAIFLNQSPTWVRITKSMFFFPFVLSPAVIGFVFQYFYDPSGPLEGMYDLLGWDAGITGDQNKATYGIIVAGWYPQIAYCMIIYLAGLTAIEPEQIEAARLDGAKGWKLFRRIIMPQLWPATFIALVVTMIGALRSFDLVQVMTGGGPGRGSSDVMARYMYQKTLFDQDYGYGSTIAVLLFMIMLVFIAIFIGQMVKQGQEG